jgi:hypothetical protein
MIFSLNLGANYMFSRFQLPQIARVPEQELIAQAVKLMAEGLME